LYSHASLIYMKASQPYSSTVQHDGT
jgi:hypothetical protein